MTSFRMQTLHSSPKLKKVLDPLRKKGKAIGFVPTMGSLHEGHLALVRRAKKENDIVVVSIFVNPLQFGPKEDYKRYPRNFTRDAQLLRRENTTILFEPSLKDFYPSDFQTSVSLNKLSKPLCGARRPAHFGGVCTVVLKLLGLVTPDRLYLGQKDYQQFRVVEQMVRDLDFPAEVKMVPIVREKDGLAMSSRNIFLSKAERAEAVFLYRALQEGQRLVRAGTRDLPKIRKMMRAVLKKASLGRLDYLEIVDARSLEPVVELRSGSRVLIALAAFFGKTRLIDNLLIRV